MPQIMPNSAIVVAVIMQTETYSRQDDFNILLLEVKSAAPKGEEFFMFDKERDTVIKALVSKLEYKYAHVKENTTVTVELKKVSIDLWRVIRFIAT